MLERLISFAASDGDAYGAIALTGEEAGAAFTGDGTQRRAIDDAVAERGDGAIRMPDDEGGDLVVGIAAGTSPLGFETQDGRTVSVQAVGVSGDLPGGGSFEGPGVSWTLEGGASPAAVRTLWSLQADGSLLVLFAIRDPGAGNHADETLGAGLIQRDGKVESYAQPLLSTEYDAAGEHTRATLELWSDSEAEVPARGAGKRRFGGAAQLGDATLMAARFEWRLEGVGGAGGYEIFTA
jgi:hypothetical protein